MMSHSEQQFLAAASEQYTGSSVAAIATTVAVAFALQTRLTDEPGVKLRDAGSAIVKHLGSVKDVADAPRQLRDYVAVGGKLASRWHGASRPIDGETASDAVMQRTAELRAKYPTFAALKDALAGAKRVPSEPDYLARALAAMVKVPVERRDALIRAAAAIAANADEPAALAEAFRAEVELVAADIAARRVAAQNAADDLLAVPSNAADEAINAAFLRIAA